MLLRWTNKVSSCIVARHGEVLHETQCRAIRTRRLFYPVEFHRTRPPTQGTLNLIRVSSYVYGHYPRKVTVAEGTKLGDTIRVHP